MDQQSSTWFNRLNTRRTALAQLHTAILTSFLFIPSFSTVPVFPPCNLLEPAIFDVGCLQLIHFMHDD